MILNFAVYENDETGKCQIHSRKQVASHGVVVVVALVVVVAVFVFSIYVDTV